MRQSKIRQRAFLRVFGGLWLSLASTVAFAQQADTYAYDVHGRLTSVHQGVAPSESLTTYDLDAAGNRTRVTKAPIFLESWNAAALPHGAGFAEEGGWAANIHTPQVHIIYGPYAPAPAGQRIAIFQILIDVANPLDASAVGVIDVNDASTMEVLASRTLSRSDFAADWTYQYFELPFTIPLERSGHAIEYRVYFHANSHIRIRKVGYR